MGGMSGSREMLREVQVAELRRRKQSISGIAALSRGADVSEEPKSGTFPEPVSSSLRQSWSSGEGRKRCPSRSRTCNLQIRNPLL
jgi:hypothetical protein